MYFKLSFFSVVFHLICICAAGETNYDFKATISVFYETYCPDSIKFITQQLYPTYSNLNGSYFIPHMLPFGRANISNLTNGTVVFSCQHGDKECYGNKVHACVLNLNGPLLSSKMKFINCSMVRTDVKNTNTFAYPIDECAAESQISAQEIKACVANVSYSDNLLIAYGNQTKKYPIPSFPFIMFDDNFNATRSQESEKNFAEVICKSFIPSNDTKTESVCKKSDKNSANTLTITAFPIIVLTFLICKLFY